MASDQSYLDYILSQLKPLDDIQWRRMMSEYILYYNGKVFGGIYDNRLLVKPVESAKAYMHKLSYELPYEGGKEMLLVDDVDDSEYLCNLVKAMEPELAYPKRKKKV